MALLDGKQIKATSIADGKLATSYTKSDGTRAFTGDQSMGGFKLTNLAAPVSANDAARKADVDVAKNNFDFKDSAKWATTAALPAYTGTGTGVLTLTGQTAWSPDGTPVSNGERVVVKNEGSGTHLDNGIYSVSGVGTLVVLTRTEDANVSAEVTAGLYIFVDQGTTNANTAWVITTNDAIVLNTTALTFGKYSGLGQISAGNGITLTGDTVSVNIDSETGGNIQPVNLTANGVGLDIAAIVGNGLEADGAANLNVKAVNDTINVAAGGVKAAVPRNANKAIVASVTTADFQTTGASISSTPAGDSYVTVMVNGVRQEVGDGVKTKDCYFSADAGVTARAISAITAADVLYWVGSVAGFELATTDEIDIDYVIA